ILAGIDRIHSAAQAVEAVHEARRAGFDNLNLDLMYGLPGQSLADWEATLRQALALRPEHLSTYALILEEGTPLQARVRRGEVALPDEDQVADMDEAMEALLRPAGYRRYEISNWSLPGRRCRHNCHYWANRDYLGLGCGAVSYLNGWRYRRILHPVRYAAALSQGRSPVMEGERLGTEAALTESLILGLRTVRGVDLERLARRHGLPGAERLVQAFDSVPGHLVRRRGPRVRLTRRGREIASEVFVQLLEAALTLEPPARG
ncbi:MAG TPA: coproporphyrinogen-III oxidase family protein, partial [Candidatus Nitrosotenuis sp.]|nr:coproporphyrinogen-III oxidase family protein [Candidatus Nitrosotenuis sp.]